MNARVPPSDFGQDSEAAAAVRSAILTVRDNLTSIATLADLLVLLSTVEDATARHKDELVDQIARLAVKSDGVLKAVI